MEVNRSSFRIILLAVANKFSIYGANDLSNDYRPDHKLDFYHNCNLIVFLRRLRAKGIRELIWLILPTNHRLGDWIAFVNVKN